MIALFFDNFYELTNVTYAIIFFFIYQMLGGWGRGRGGLLSLTRLNGYIVSLGRRERGGVPDYGRDHQDALRYVSPQPGQGSAHR